MDRTDVSIAALLLSLALPLSSCGDQELWSGLEPGVAQQVQEIVGGSIEPGWPGVGALTFQYPGYGYQGSFCTGTLITDSWVLTAAHCLTEHDGFALTPDIVMFFVGADANPTGASGFPAGSFYQAQSFHLQDDYDEDTNEHDIALVRLAEPASGISPYTYNSLTLNGDNVGDEVFYVGYGVTEGINNSGGGIKRSATIRIASVQTNSYTSEYEGSGVCFGDSGGPGLLQLGGDWQIIGVNSTVASASSDPCTGWYNDTRVDRYATWIAGVLGVPPPDCGSNPDVCFCAAACQDGSCDNSACETLSCEEIYDCMGLCPTDDVGCQNNCYLRGTPTGKEQLNAVLQCATTYCDNMTGDAYQQCASDNCGTQIEICMPIGTGDQSCEQVYDCMVSCPSGDNTCQWDCYETGTAGAQGELDAMLDCFDAECGTLSDEEWQQCATTVCSAEIGVCFPADNCDITGGDCPAGEACFATTAGTTSCFPTDGIPVGGACDPTNFDTLECADGALCLQAGSEGVCIAFCLSTADCASGEVCEIPVFTGTPDIGACLCRDDDGDGSCAEDDCDDGDATAYPGNNEICGDGVDNDCDPQTSDPCAGVDGGSSGADAGSTTGGGDDSEGGDQSGGDTHTASCLFSAYGPAGAAWWPLLALLPLGWLRRRS